MALSTSAGLFCTTSTDCCHTSAYKWDLKYLTLSLLDWRIVKRDQCVPILFWTWQCKGWRMIFIIKIKRVLYARKFCWKVKSEGTFMMLHLMSSHFGSKRKYRTGSTKSYKEKKGDDYSHLHRTVWFTGFSHLIISEFGPHTTSQSFQTVASSEPPRGFFKTLIAGLHPRVSDSLGSGWSRLIHFFSPFFGHTTQHVGSYLPNQGLNLHLLHWKCRVLTAREVPIICISNRFLGDADAAGPQTTLWESLGIHIPHS